MDRELVSLQTQVKSVEENFGIDNLHLTVARGYIRKLIANPRIIRWLSQHQPEYLPEFQSIAKIVRHLFRRYLELRPVRALVDETAASGLTGRSTTRGKSSGIKARPFGRGALYHLLSNPVYVGKTRHRDHLYEGEHQLIIDDDVFAAVQARLAVQAPRRSANTNTPDIHLLTGIVFDETGDRLRPVHVNKNGKRYHYQVSSRLTRARKKGIDGWRIPASELESLVEHQLGEILSVTTQLADWIEEREGSAVVTLDAVHAARDHVASMHSNTQPERKAIMQRVFRRIELRRNWIHFEIDKAALVEWLELLHLDHVARRTGAGELPLGLAGDLPPRGDRSGEEVRHGQIERVTVLGAPV